MKKIFKTLVFLLLPLGIHAQTDSAVSANIKRTFSELCSSQKYSRIHWVIGECISDNSEVGGENVNDMSDWQYMMLFNIGPCSPTLKDYWMRSYNIIAQANKIIADVPGTTFSEDQKKLNIAEAKFLRSLAYFDLVTIFGGVPIYTDTFAWKMSGNPSDYTGNFVFKARNTIAEVFTQIESDLKEAILSLPERSLLSPGTVYYATKGAAGSLLAKMYLYQSSYAKNYPGDSRFTGLTQQWGKALQYAEEVINSGEYKLVGSDGETYNTWWDNSYLYKTTPGFRYMFTKAGNDCSESVFEVRNLFPENGYLSYTANEISQFTTCRYIYKNNMKYNSGTGWGFNTPTQDLINEFASESGNAKNDPRFQATVGIDGDSILIQDSTWKKIYVSSAPTKAFCRKYEISPSESVKRSIHGYYTGESNIKVIRFADVLLWASEAALELGDNAKALAYINMVRSRARKCGNTSYPSDLTSVSFNDIIHERRLELALEGHRFFDLVRWNLASSKLNGRFNETSQINVVFTSGVNEFFPLPHTVMELANGVVAQNNGYDDLCPHLEGIRDIFIKPDAPSNILDLTGTYSTNKIEEPNIIITSSNLALATISLVNRKLNINYNNLSDGDTTKVTLTMNYGNSQQKTTSFMIRVLQPLFTAQNNEINKCYYGSWRYTYEIKPFYEKYGLNNKKTTTYTVNFNNSMSSSPYVNDVRIDTLIGMAINFNRSYFYTLAKEQNYKGNDIIPMLVILRNRPLYKFYAIDVPVKVSDVIPFISISRPQLAGDEISFNLSTTTINKDDSSYFNTPDLKTTYTRTGFKFGISYDTDNLEYLGYDFDNTFMSDLTHEVIVDNSGGNLTFSDSTLQPITGEGKLVSLIFRDLGSGLGTINAKDFQYIVFSEQTIAGSYYSGHSGDSYNILVANDVIGIEKSNKSAKSIVQLSPNPAVNNILIRANFSNYTILLYSADGRLLKRYQSVNSTLTVPVNDLIRGMYFVKVIKAGETQNLKFIKR
jgi:starch-binding outer membrane protein, SusD/RagB family